MFMGMGSKSVILIKCHDNGTMDETDLENKVKQTLENPDVR